MSALDEYQKAAQKAWNQERYLVPGVVYDALAKADAAIAELEAMLRLAWEEWQDEFGQTLEKWLADLRARAEEGA